MVSNYVAHSDKTLKLRLLSLQFCLSLLGLLSSVLAKKKNPNEPVYQESSHL